MNNPFFTNPWAHSQYPSRHPYYYYSPSPVYQTQPPVHHPEPVHRYPEPVHVNPVRKPESSAPKVVRIPVQFGNSETVQPVRSVRSVPSRFESVVKIQKAFRGFLVRKTVKKIKLIKNEVDEIEKRVGERDYVELLKKDEKERLKVNEMLMGLLFKLDSIRGFCSGVRDCRKAVIKKAIALQERVDSLIAAKIEEIDQNPDDYEENVSEMHQFDDQIEDPVEIEVENAENKALESEESPDKGEVENAEDGALESEESEEDSDEDKMEDERDEKDEINVNFTSCEDDIEMNGEGEEVCDEMKNVDEDLKGKEGIKGSDEKELLEKLMEENGKMMSLMNQLFERSEMQTQMLNSLTQRVEHLEKAFICDRMRKKKTKKNKHGYA